MHNPYGEPTEDTPQQREDKAEELADEFNRFKWEMRAYISILFLFIIVKELVG